MIPKPPFPWELSEDREAREFERLKAHLSDFWGETFPRDDVAYTSIVVPSLSLDPSELGKLAGAPFYEERLLFLLIRLRNPKARLVYVTSQPIHPQVLDYYLQLLSGVPSSHARSRLTLLCAYDASSRPLTEKILARPRLIERIRVNIPDRSRAYLTVFNSTPLERRLSVLLDIPLNAADPALVHHGSKSGSRRLFREVEIAHPLGFEDVASPGDVVFALRELRAARPGLRRAVVKLNDSFSGEGNAVVELGEDDSPASLRRAVEAATFGVTEDVREAYWDQLRRTGGVVEELLEAEGASSPSVQLRINPRGQCFVTSTHEQILGGPNGQVYEGCRFPAREVYRVALQEAGLRVAEGLAARGVTSRLSVDFLAVPGPGSGAFTLFALEINLRMGGTTHPMLALRFLTGGQLDASSGVFRDLGGAEKCYRATDNLVSARYAGLLPEDLVEILTVNHLEYSWRTATGVLFHMIGAISEYGKVGMVAIGNSAEEADEIYARTVRILDDETRYGAPAQEAGPRPPSLPALRREAERPPLTSGTGGARASLE